MIFEEYCVHAAHALETSLKTSNKRIVRYDEKYDNSIDDKMTLHACSPDESAEPTHNEQYLMGVNAEYISSILGGDYSNIPVEQLPSLIESLENFFGYALEATLGNKKASCE